MMMTTTTAAVCRPKTNRQEAKSPNDTPNRIERKIIWWNQKHTIKNFFHPFFSAFGAKFALSHNGHKVWLYLYETRRMGGYDGVRVPKCRRKINMQCTRLDVMHHLYDLLMYAVERVHCINCARALLLIVLLYFEICNRCSLLRHRCVLLSYILAFWLMNVDDLTDLTIYFFFCIIILMADCPARM